MRAAATTALVSLLAVFARPAAPCVEPQGIVPGGGEGLLDLSVLLTPESLEHPLAPLNTPNPVGECSGELHTTIGMRLLTAIDTAAFSMGAMYEPNGVALDIFGDKETSDARRRCQPTTEAGRELLNLHLKVGLLYMTGYAVFKYMPYCSEEITELMEEFGCPISLVDVADGDPEPSTDTPWGLTKAYLDETMAFLIENDGWNADGGLGGKEVNRIPFSSDFSFTDSEGNSWDGYKPKNTPYKFKHTKRWQPLLESDDLGTVITKEHVTPHIGITARFFGFDTAEAEKAWGSRELDEPPYRNKHAQVARQVIEDSKIAANDTAKQYAMSFFDNKWSSLVPLKISYFLQRTDSLSLLDFISITTKSQLTIYNTVVLSWREKIRHDAPRPPSVVRNELGDQMVEAYAGPDLGVQTIKASEWEPYILTMSHSEYPSGSSCICEGFVTAVKLWAGADTIEPPIQFPSPALGEPILEFASWSEISQMCSESRVWAGLHFQGAVSAGLELCGGDEMPLSIATSLDALHDGDESAAVFNRDIGELMLRPL